MVSINSNSVFIGTKALALKQNQPEEENNQETTVENETANEETTKQEVAKFVGYNQIGTGTLLAINGIKINKPAEPEQPSIELNSNFEFDDFNDFAKTRGTGIFKDGDTISIGDRKGKVMTLVDPYKRVSHKEHQYLIVVFEDGSSYRL